MKNLSPAEEELKKKITKRVALFEEDIERQIYVDLPQHAMKFDALLKMYPLFSTDFLTQLETHYREMLALDADMNEVTVKLQTPAAGLFELEETARANATSLGELLEAIKRWFYIAVPGGSEMNKMQEEMDQVLSGMEEGVSKVMENLLYYHTQRGKLYAKLQKRKLFDIAKTLAQFDLAQVTNIKNSFTDLYNSLVVAYDATVKNFENIKTKNASKSTPAQGASASGMF